MSTCTVKHAVGRLLAQLCVDLLPLLSIACHALSLPLWSVVAQLPLYIHALTASTLTLTLLLVANCHTGDFQVFPLTATRSLTPPRNTSL